MGRNGFGSFHVLVTTNNSMHEREAVIKVAKVHDMIGYWNHVSL